MEKQRLNLQSKSFSWLLFTLLFLCLSMVHAQQSRKITGAVADNDTKEPLPGVSVVVKGTTLGTTTDFDGNFSIEVPLNGKVLVFSYIGYANQEVEISNRSSINITLLQDVENLDEVVVTALGIKREEKTLGYAVSKVEGSEISQTEPTNWLNGLAGKVPGLQLTSSGAGPGGSVRVVLRGQNSLDLRKGEALFVIDGVPVVSGSAGGNDNRAYNPSGDPSIDYGNAISEINPEDIESVSVLRGPAAAALYGSSAGSGAIIITTKSGGKGGLKFTINSSIAFDTPLRWPDYQYEYGEGQRNIGAHNYYSYGSSIDGPNTRSTHTWGPRFEGQMFYQYDPVTQEQGTQRTPWISNKDYVKGFYRTGTTTTNSFSIQGGAGKNSFRLSYTNLENEYIVPNTGYSQNSLAFSSSQEFDKFQINSKINYYNRSSKNVPSAGYSARSVAYSLLWSAPNVPVEWYENYWKDGKTNILQNNFYNGGDDNLYFSVYEQLNGFKSNRIFGNLSATYNFNKKINFTVRSGVDLGNRLTTNQRPFSSINAVEGEYKEQERNVLKLDNDFLFKYMENLGSNFDMSITVGGSNTTRTWNNNTSTAERLNYPGLYSLANSKDQVFSRNNHYKKVVNSLYGLAQFSFKSQIFLDLTARNDWSSTLPPKNNSFFYPSVSTSFILTDLFDLSSVKQLSFAKLRGSIAQVGNDTDPYQTTKYYTPSPIGGSYSNPTVLPNLELEPEIITSREIGLDIRFFSNRLGLDITYYNSDSKNQILEVPADPATGFQYRTFNAGLINNKGWEIGLNAKPIVKEKGFNWSTNLTWSKNVNKVVELAEGVESIVLSQGPRGFVQASVGGSLGDIYGGGLLRNEDGQVIYDSSGYPQLDLTLKKLGSSIPDWTAGISNQFSYKNWSLSFLFDGKMGGKMYSLTHSVLAYTGKLKKTLPGRYNGLIGEGVQVNPDGSYRPNDIVTDEISLYYNALYQRDNAEMNTFDTSFIKLRTASIQFQFPSTMVGKGKFLKDGSIGVFGNDLLLFTEFPAFDPEVGTLNGDQIEPGFETGQLPSTRSYGVKLSLSF